MKALLTTINSKFIHQNLAIRLLYELNKDHKELSWKEFINKDSSDEIAQYCSQFQLIAFSCSIWNRIKTLEVIAKLKSIKPGCMIMLGGPEVSFDWEDLINHEHIDFVIAGEGEIPFSKFLELYPALDAVPGLIWKKNSKIIENQNPELFDLHLLGNINPYINDSTEDLKNKICYIEASRGCPYSCDFCLAGLDKKVRYIPLETVKTNLLFLMKNAGTIKFLDRTFNISQSLAIAILEFITEHHKPGNIFQFEIKADIIQEELIDFIRTKLPNNLIRFEIGIQTLNDKSNEAIGRKQNFDAIKKFIRQISDKIEIHLDLIVGLPYDFWEDIKFSFEEVFRLYAPELQLGFLKFLKGTPVRNNASLHGYQFEALPPYQIFESNYLSNGEIKKISMLEKALEVYWNKKRSLYTLKYISENYSVFDFLLGLGNFFEMKSGFVKYNHNDIYTNLYEFAKQFLPKDIIVHELIVIDYYLHFKVKPKTRFLNEIDKQARNKIFLEYKLNHHKYRYIIHLIHFNLERYLNENRIYDSEDLLIIQYDGVNKAQLVFNG